MQSKRQSKKVLQKGLQTGSPTNLISSVNIISSVNRTILVSKKDKKI